MRQPHSSSASAGRRAANSAPIAEPIRKPPLAASDAMLPTRPRRPGGARSTRKTIDMVASPPTDRPWIMREQREQDRRGDAQRGVARQYAHQERRHRHGGDGEGEGGAAAVAVADMADHHAAQGTHQIAQGKDAEGRQHLRHGILGGKEHATDRGGEIAVDREIVPFEQVADHAGGDGAAGAWGLHSPDYGMAMPPLNRSSRNLRTGRPLSLPRHGFAGRRRVGDAAGNGDFVKQGERLVAALTDEGRYRLLIDAVTDYAIYMLDSNGRVTSWNPGAQRLKGYAEAEILGSHFSRFYTEEDRQDGVPAHALETAVREGRFEKEGWRIRKDGRRFWAHVVIDPIRDEAGGVIGFAKVTRDLTERRDAQLALDQAREALFQSQKMEAVGQLTGGIAHDFNNLLTAILGSLELVRTPAARRSQDDCASLDNAMQAAQRGAALTQRMLAFARRQNLDPEPLDVPDAGARHDRPAAAARSAPSVDDRDALPAGARPRAGRRQPARDGAAQPDGERARRHAGRRPRRHRGACRGASWPRACGQSRARDATSA